MTSLCEIASGEGDDCSLEFAEMENFLRISANDLKGVHSSRRFWSAIRRYSVVCSDFVTNPALTSANEQFVLLSRRAVRFCCFLTSVDVR